MDMTRTMERIYLFFGDLITDPSLIANKLDEGKRQQALTDLHQLKGAIAQAQDGTALLEVFIRLDTLLQESGIEAAVTDKPAGSASDRLKKADVEKIKAQAEDSAWREQQKKLLDNILPQVAHILETTLPKQDKNVS